MGFWGRLFGKKKDEGGDARAQPNGRPHAETTQQSLERLTKTVDMLNKREELLRKRMDAEVQNARDKLAKKDKTGAAACLRRKKLMEAQLEQLLAKSQNVELMKLNIEQAVLDQELAASMHVGASAIRASGMDADSISDTMFEIQESMEIAQGASSALAEPMGDSALLDGEDLLREFEMEEEEDALERELMEGLGEASGSEPVPAIAQPGRQPQPELNVRVPTGKIGPSRPAAVRDPEEEELERLAAGMGMEL